MVEVLELSQFKRTDLERAEKQVSFQVASQHCVNVLTSMITCPLSLLKFEKVLFVCGNKEFRYTSNMAETRRYLWTQRVKCPNREDMRSKVTQSLLDAEGIPADSWTTSLEELPALTHAIVEDFFRKTNDKRHVTEGYAFSKTKKVETSGRPIRLNLLPDHAMFLLEGHTRPAVKQAKSISTGKGIYSCSLLLSKETGKIIAAKDKSCAAGKRGFCEHIAALAHKLVEAKVTGATELPKPISCTDVRQQWGLPSIKAQQDPEKEAMKRNPLQEIVFEKHILTRDNLGGRKRKLITLRNKLQLQLKTQG